MRDTFDEQAAKKTCLTMFGKLPAHIKPRNSQFLQYLEFLPLDDGPAFASQAELALKSGKAFPEYCVGDSFLGIPFSRFFFGIRGLAGRSFEFVEAVWRKWNFCRGCRAKSCS